MDAKAFFDLTARVRDAQKLYFRISLEPYRAKQEALAASKKLEAELDAEINRVRGILEREKYKQQNPVFPGFDEELLNRTEQ